MEELSEGGSGGGGGQEKGDTRKGPRPPINRYLLVVILCLYCLFSGPAYFNWTPIADTLLHHGAFEWRCTPEEVAAAVSSPNFVSYEPRCAAQEMAVNSLFGIASSSHFFCSFLGGLLLDLLGPKVTGMIGVSVMFLGWLLLALSSQSFDCFTLAAVLVGLSVDTAFFPCLSAANLFPSKSSTVIAFFGCFRSLSFVVPLAMRAAVVQSKIASTPQSIFVYCGLFLTCCFFVASFLLPRSSYERKEGDTKETLAKDVSCNSSTKHLALTEAATGLEPPAAAAATAPGVPAGAAAAAAAGRRRSLRQQASLKLQAFGGECCSLPYLPLLPLFSFMLTSIIFYVPSTLHLLPAAYEANQVIQTVSFLPCPFLGFLADRIGILPVMHLTNLCGLLSYVCVLIPSIPAYAPLQFLSSVLFTVQISFLMSQFYCYCSVTFSQQNLGKLVGLICACGGLFSLVSGPMRAYALERGFTSMCILCLCLALCNAMIVSFLHILHLRRARAKRRHLTDTQQDLEAMSPPHPVL